MSKRELSVEGKVENKKVADYLESLAKSIKAGKLVVQKGNEALVLTPAAVISMEVEAKQKKDKEKFEIKLEWENTMNEDGDLKISINSKTE